MKKLFIIVLCSIEVFDLPRLCGDIEKLMMASSTATAPEEPPSCYWRLCLYGFYSNSQDEPCSDDSEEYEELEQGPSHSTPFHPHKQNVKLVSILRNPQPQHKSKKKHFFGKKQKRTLSFGRSCKHVTWKDGGAQEEEYDEDDDSEYGNPNVSKMMIDEWRFAECWVRCAQVKGEKQDDLKAGCEMPW